MSMDPLFDRLGRLIRSLGVDSTHRERTRAPIDPLEREAEEELDEFLRTGRTASPKPGPRPGPGARPSGHQPPPRPSLDPAVEQAYQTLGVAPGASWDDINAAHRTLLKKHHPDRFADNPVQGQAATLQAQKINEAHQILKKFLGR